MTFWYLLSPGVFKIYHVTFPATFLLKFRNLVFISFIHIHYPDDNVGELCKMLHGLSNRLKKCQIFSSPPKKNQKILFFHSCQSARGNMYKDKILEFLPLVEFNYSYYNMIIKIDGNGSLGTDCRINCFPTSLILYQCKMNSLMRM